MEIAVTYDNRCPFARLAHLYVLDALAAGTDLDVRFVPFCSGQLHVAEGQADIWDRPADDSGLLALQASVVVRDDHPDAFLAVHRDLFAVRHVHGRRLDEASVRAVLADRGLDADGIVADIAQGKALQRVREEHEWAAEVHGAWGVPTFVVGDRAAFVRLTEAPADEADARRGLERIVGLVGGWPELHELKHTTLDR